MRGKSVATQTSVIEQRKTKPQVTASPRATKVAIVRVYSPNIRSLVFELDAKFARKKRGFVVIKQFRIAFPPLAPALALALFEIAIIVVRKFGV